MNETAGAPTTDCTIELLGPDEAALLESEILTSYRTAFSASHWDKSELGIVAFENDIFPRHLKREGFAMTAARNGAGKLVGFCYGYIGEHGQYWTDYVAARIHPSLEKAWLGGHFEVAELAVEEEERGKGLGRALLTTLLDSRGEDRVALHDTRAGFAGAAALRVAWVHARSASSRTTSCSGQRRGQHGA